MRKCFRNRLHSRVQDVKRLEVWWVCNHEKKERMSRVEPPVSRGLNMRLTSTSTSPPTFTSSLLLLLLLLLLPYPGETGGMGWMTVDGYGNPTPADHQVSSGGRLPVWYLFDSAGHLRLRLPAVRRPQCGRHPLPHQDDPRHELRLRGGGLPVDNRAQLGAKKSKTLFPACLVSLSITHLHLVRRDGTGPDRGEWK